MTVCVIMSAVANKESTKMSFYLVVNGTPKSIENK